MNLAIPLCVVYFTNVHALYFVKWPTAGWSVKKLRGLSPRANYTDRAAAAGRRS